jgi:hypothetical protein
VWNVGGVFVCGIAIGTNYSYWCFSYFFELKNCVIFGFKIHEELNVNEGMDLGVCT